MWWQVRFGHRECVELLLAVPGVDLEATDAMGRGLEEIARWDTNTAESTLVNIITTMLFFSGGTTRYSNY